MVFDYSPGVFKAQGEGLDWRLGHAVMIVEEIPTSRKKREKWGTRRHGLLEGTGSLSVMGIQRQPSLWTERQPRFDDCNCLHIDRARTTGHNPSRVLGASALSLLPGA
jgi:hypothetical protein